MFDWKNFPWTDFQDLNLDWILRKIKELKTVDLPALDEKIDNVYDYIRENLPSIIQQLASVIIDVTTVGATGDGVTDDSAAIVTALTMGSVLYFPKGQYRFKEITVEKPVIIFGDGEKSILTPLRKHSTTNQWFKMFNFKDSAALYNLQLRPLDPLPSESGTVYYNEAIIEADRAEHFHADHVILDNIFEATHLSWADPVFVDFEDRRGMAFYVHNCADVCFSDCDVHEFGGDELIWISQDRDKFADGNVQITGCKFTEHYSGLGGSAINVLGGNLVFADNIIHNFNNLNTAGTSGGSLFNLMGNNTMCSNNMFTNCSGGNYIDFSEGFFAKSKNVTVTGNMFGGDMVNSNNIMAENITVKNNRIRSTNALLISGTDRAWTYTTAGGQSIQVIPYCEDVNTVYTTYKKVEITDNIFEIVKPVFSLSEIPVHTVISLHWPSANSGGYVKYEQLDIVGNQFIRDSDAVGKGIVYLNMPLGVLNASRNYVKGAGVSYPAYPANPSSPIDGVTAYRSFISGAYKIDEMIVQYNILDMYEYESDTTDGLCIVAGTGPFVTQSRYYLCFNQGIGKVRDHASINASISYLHTAYNDVQIIAT